MKFTHENSPLGSSVAPDAGPENGRCMRKNAKNFSLYN